MLEIERKFLLNPDTEFYLVPEHYVTRQTIFQGYLTTEPVTVRIRSYDRRYFDLNIKTKVKGTKFTRTEVEKRIREAEFDILWPSVMGSLEKVRYVIGNGWVLDTYRGQHHGLVVAEVELASEDEDIEMPAWLVPFVMKEVTDDKSYSNLALAMRE